MIYKYCEDCGAVIATWPGSEWGRWVRVKRCTDCAAAAKLIQSAQSKRRRRRERREERAVWKAEKETARIARENLALEWQKNALLKQEIAALGGRTDWTRRQIP